MMTSPACSELSGITSLLILLHWKCTTGNITRESATLFCDDSKSLEYVFDEVTTNLLHNLKPDIDLILSAKVLSILPIKIHPRWVKEHYKGPDIEVQHGLNEMVNDVAKDFNANRICPSLLDINSLLRPCEEVALQHKETVIASKLKKVVEDNLHTSPLSTKIKKDIGWSEVVLNAVDWGAHEEAFT